MEQIFVGRGSELCQMMSIWDQIIKGSEGVPRTVLIEGEAGIGKSWLIEQFVSSIRRVKKRVWVGRGLCEPFKEIQVSFLPFYQILDDLRSQQPTRAALDQFNTIVGEIAPSWLKMLPVVGEPLSAVVESVRKLQEKVVTYQFAPSHQPDRDIYAQYLKVLHHFSGSKVPFVLIIDDLQWADELSLHLLTYLARRLPVSPKPIMILGAYRSEEAADLLRTIVHRLQQRKLCITITLQPFSGQEINEYIDQRYGLPHRSRFESFPPAFRDALLAKTGGNPLLVSELLSNLQDRGCIVRSREGWKVRAWGILDEEIPPTLEAVLQERIERLEKRLRDLLTVASVEGENFTAQVVAAVNRAEFKETLDLLIEELVRKHGVIRELEEREIAYKRFVTLYTFRHRLVRDFIYNHLSEAQKRILHQQVAECLENLYGEEMAYLIAPQLSRHYRIARHYRNFVKYGLLAARQEMRKFAIRQALWWSQEVSEVLQCQSDIWEESEIQQLRLTIMLLQTEALVRLGKHKEAVEVVNDAQKYLKKYPLFAAKFAYWKGELLSRIGNQTNAISWLRSALSVFVKEKELEWEALTLHKLGFISAVLGEFEKSRSYWTAGIRRSKILRAPHIEALILSDMAVFLNDQGDVDGSERTARKALSLFQQIGSQWGEMATLRTLADVEYLRGNLVTAESMIRQALKMAQDLEDAIYVVWCSCNLVRCLLERGKYDEAEEVIQLPLRRASEMREAGFLPDVYIFLAEIAIHRGEYDAAECYAQKAVETVSNEDVWTWPRTRYTMGKVLAAKGKPHEAEIWARSAYEYTLSAGSKLMKAYTCYEYAKSLYLTGRFREALTLVDEASRLFLEMGVQVKREEVSSLERKIRMALGSRRSLL